MSETFFESEADRLDQFPVARERVFVGHAGVSPLPRCAADAMHAHIQASCAHHQEFGDVLKDVGRTRNTCAEIIGASWEEVALLGPTSLGLSLFANGIEWQRGDELLCYRDDYPANVYPWVNLQHQGVKVRFLEPEEPGRITPELVEASLTPATKMVALASCHFLTGWRIDIDRIGELLRSRGVLFTLDAIQTIGAFPTSVKHVDFLSADAHKWMLGPLAIGIVYVQRENFDLCKPTLLGAWNIQSPDFITQDSIAFEPTARRYEPGVLNVTGTYGMKASLDMIQHHGIDRISKRILETRDGLWSMLRERGFVTVSPENDPLRSGILTVRHPSLPSEKLFAKLEAANISASLRKDRAGTSYLRFSPHFYNTLEEMERIVAALAS